MNLTTRRASAVRQALADCASALPTCRQLELLTGYVLGRLSRRQANQLLRLSGPDLYLSGPRRQPAVAAEY